MPITFKNIIVWRHAEALPVEAVGDDLARPLSAKGQRQAKRMARWLNQHLPDDLLLLSSPALRAFQTAEALKFKINIHPALQPNAALQEVLDCLSEQELQQNALLVGHQPWLGQLLAHLLGLESAETSIEKGATWWLRQSSTQPSTYKIISVQAPSHLPR